MGFTTSFVGGFTLTTSLLYFTLHLHRQNRIYQSTLLSQQRQLLTNLYDPPSEILDSPAYEVRPAGLSEQLKDRWNRELSNVIRNLQEKDWEQVRLRWERRLGVAWDRVGGDEKVDELKKRVEEVGENVKESVKDGLHTLEENVKSAAAQGKEELKKKTRELKGEAREVTGQKRLLEL